MEYLALFVAICIKGAIIAYVEKRRRNGVITVKPIRVTYKDLA